MIFIDRGVERFLLERS